MKQILTVAERPPAGTLTVRALLFIIAGHVIHHTSIIKERYA